MQGDVALAGPLRPSRVRPLGDVRAHKGAEGSHAGIAVARDDADRAPSRRDLRVAGGGAEVARVPRDDGGAANVLGLLAAELHREAPDVGAERVASVDDPERREVDDDL